MRRVGLEVCPLLALFDGDAIYMGVTCFDSDPDGWLGFQRRRDEFPGSDDHNWLDDPLLDRCSTLDKRLASRVLYTYRF
jgi:hypothetical protein